MIFRVFYLFYIKISGASNRPILGWANFDPASIDPTSDDSLAMQLGTAIHEISHALGFSGSRFSSSGLSNPVNGGGARFTGPLVRDFVRDHFGCATLDGALLENAGGGGTSGSHWEKASFFNEYMTGTAANNPVISPLTLLAFESMGFYKAQLENSDALIFGAGGGCGMSETYTGCSQWPAAYSCSPATSGTSCSADRSGYGSCVSEGAGSLIGNGCSYYQARTSCIFPIDPNSQRAKDRANGLINSGESFAEDAHCFDSTLNRVGGFTDLFPTPSPRSPKCYRTHCTAPDELRVRAVAFWHLCPNGGFDFPVSNYGGNVRCEPNLSDVWCKYKPFDPDWPRIVSIEPTKAKPGKQVRVTFTGILKNVNGTQLVVGAPGSPAPVDIPADPIDPIDPSVPMDPIDPSSPSTPTSPLSGNAGIYIETACTSIALDSSENGTMSGNIAESNFWGSPKYLSLFNPKLNVALYDEYDRSDVSYRTFTPDIAFDLAYIRALFDWMKKNPLFTFLICLAIALPIIIICFCCCKRCCCKKKKPKRSQYAATYVLQHDEYYYDEEMDDHMRHAPPQSISR